jgi:hypothetical protein
MLPNVARNDRATITRPTRDASLTLPGEVCVCNTHPGNDRTHKAQNSEHNSQPAQLPEKGQVARIARVVHENEVQIHPPSPHNLQARENTNTSAQPAQPAQLVTSDAPHVLLTVSDAAELLRIVTQSRPINHDQTELVADLAAIVRRARAIETRSNR